MVHANTMPPATVVTEHDGPKETIESIIIALILALVFRAFIVEAFVIPTGSMAPTLYGAHGTIMCQDCGTEFAYGLRDLEETRHGRMVNANALAKCPNCEHPNGNLVINDAARNPEKGDRILVLKWPLETGLESLELDRWDVVVFKDPANGHTNFIKRLVGLPEEVLVILDGDIFAAPFSELSQSTLDELDSLRREKYELRHHHRMGRMGSLSEEAWSDLAGALVIAPKTAAAQSELWFPVYNHDFPPHTIRRKTPILKRALGDSSAWTKGRNSFAFDGRDAQKDFISLNGKEITASNAYNIGARPSPPVGDHRLSFVLTPHTDDFLLHVRLSKLARDFWATIRGDGSVTICHDRHGPPTKEDPVMASASLDPFAAGRPVPVQFENVDYQLVLRIDGEVVLASSRDPQSKAHYGPIIASLRRQVVPPRAKSPRIYGVTGEFTVAHISIDRDIYYYNLRDYPFRWAPKGGWASAKSPMLLREDEFFMLGDNTAASKDSRLWDQVDARFDYRGEGFQLGTVPRDQLIGKAFFVYWPSALRVSWLSWLPILHGGVVPDVGHMRWIR